MFFSSSLSRRLVAVLAYFARFWPVLGGPVCLGTTLGIILLSRCVFIIYVFLWSGPSCRCSPYRRSSQIIHESIHLLCSQPYQRNKRASGCSFAQLEIRSTSANSTGGSVMQKTVRGRQLTNSKEPTTTNHDQPNWSSNAKCQSEHNHRMFESWWSHGWTDQQICFGVDVFRVDVFHAVVVPQIFQRSREAFDCRYCHIEGELGPGGALGTWAAGVAEVAGLHLPVPHSLLSELIN